jgi:hypothetical protein
MSPELIIFILYSLVGMVMAIWGLSIINNNCNNDSLFLNLRILLVTSAVCLTIFSSSLACNVACYSDFDDPPFFTPFCTFVLSIIMFTCGGLITTTDMSDCVSDKDKANTFQTVLTYTIITYALPCLYSMYHLWDWFKRGKKKALEHAEKREAIKAKQTQERENKRMERELKEQAELEKRKAEAKEAEEKGKALKAKIGEGANKKEQEKARKEEERKDSEEKRRKREKLEKGDFSGLSGEEIADYYKKQELGNVLKNAKIQAGQIRRALEKPGANKKTLAGVLADTEKGIKQLEKGENPAFVRIPTWVAPETPKKASPKVSSPKRMSLKSSPKVSSPKVSKKPLPPARKNINTGPPPALPPRPNKRHSRESIEDEQFFTPPSSTIRKTQKWGGGQGLKSVRIKELRSLRKPPNASPKNRHSQ